MVEKWTAEIIKEKLKTNNKWLIKGILAIYSKQTELEQCREETCWLNKAGFSAFDADIMSSFAKQILSHNTTKFKEPLSPKQLQIARKRMLKYAGQLAKIANKEDYELP